MFAVAALLEMGCAGTAGDLFGTDGDAAGGGGRSGTLGRAGQVTSIDGEAGDGSGVGSAGGAGSAPVGAGASPGIGAGPSSGSAGAGNSGAGAGTSGSDGDGSGDNGAGSGGPGGGAGGDGSGAPECDPCPCSDGPFSPPELVAGLGIGAANGSFGPAPSADGLTLYFSSVGAQEDLEDIVFATRGTRANQFTGFQLVPGINDPSAADGTPFISADDRALYFFSTRPDPEAPGDRDLWVAARAGAGAPFSAPALVPGVNSAGLEHLPRLTPDGLSLLFVSGRDTVNLGSNIWQADRALPSAAFGVPVELPGVNSDARDEGFWLSADGLTVFFASNRQPEANMDIWVATRADVGDAFGEPENLSAVNTAGIEIDPALTLDGFELFFASDRSGSMQLYRSARICE
jgi:Tol biopolymer transport system component